MNNLLSIAIWTVCFYDVIILLMLPSTISIFFSPDGSSVRYIVNILAVGIAMLALTKNGFRCLPSKSIAIFLLAIIISAVHSPNIYVDSTFMPHDSAIFNYKPMFEMMVFFLMFMGVYSLNTNTEGLFKSLALIGAIYGSYIILQRLGIDQFYQINLPGDGEINHLSRNPEAGAFVNQPVFAAAFMAMCLPFALRVKSWWKILLCVIGIILTGNRGALVASFLSVLFLYRKTFRLSVILTWILGIVILGIIGLTFTSYSFVNHIPASGRIGVWHNILMNFVHNPFPGVNKGYILTGFGIGAFPVLFPFYNHSGFYQAHLEYLEVLFGLGLLGFISMIYVIKDIIRIKGNKNIGAALLAIAICACFNPVWHIPQLQFLSVMLLGLYYKGESYDLENRTTI